MQIKRILKISAVILGVIVLLIIAVNLYYLPQTVEFSAVFHDEDGREIPAGFELTRRRFLDADPIYSGTMRLDGETIALSGFSAERRTWGLLVSFYTKVPFEAFGHEYLHDTSLLWVSIGADGTVPENDFALLWDLDGDENREFTINPYEWRNIYKKVAKLCP